MHLHHAYGNNAYPVIPADRLSAAADTGHNLDQLRSDEWTDTAHIQFAFNHKS